MTTLAGKWQKLPDNPIFDHSFKDVWDKYPSAPHILRVGNKLRMYYYGERPGPRGKERRIGFAEASLDDPMNWIKSPSNPVLDLSKPGNPDSVWCAYPWVLPINDRLWYMYYAGFGDEWVKEDFKLNYTLLAISYDAGITWKRSGLGPLLPLGIPGSPHEHGSGSCSVLKVGEEYWMWYTALRTNKNYPTRKNLYIGIALATSKDGLNFTPHKAGLVIKPDFNNPIEDYICSKPVVYYDNGKFKLWYNSAGSEYKVRYAESIDGINFKIDPKVVIDTSNEGWDSDMTEYVCTINEQERELLFYSGNNFSGIGVAKKIHPQNSQIVD
ncbi:MAG: hypothetical protein CL758_05070 [Chloroflexi bacterium]|nr:hypothetical protein [Chloroflexota bacterium]|tara:strand:+ start:20597 stop:21574 length:978 start_codon:yes stop_codon:yes gene_type:complete